MTEITIIDFFDRMAEGLRCADACDELTGPDMQGAFEAALFGTYGNVGAALLRWNGYREELDIEISIDARGLVDMRDRLDAQVKAMGTELDALKRKVSTMEAERVEWLGRWDKMAQTITRLERGIADRDLIIARLEAQREETKAALPQTSVPDTG